MQHCFWILEDKTIVRPDSRHILAIRAAPGAFGETQETLQATFRQYGEEYNNNVESIARQVIMLRVINRNHIRIRKYNLKGCQHWIIQLNSLDEDKRAVISDWAAACLDAVDDRYADVIIEELRNGNKIRTSLAELAAASKNAEQPVFIDQAELGRRYS